MPATAEVFSAGGRPRSSGLPRWWKGLSLLRIGQDTTRLELSARRGCGRWRRLLLDDDGHVFADGGGATAVWFGNDRFGMFGAMEVLLGRLRILRALLGCCRILDGGTAAMLKVYHWSMATVGFRCVLLERGLPMVNGLK
ncbi:hypothetical protein HPB47_006946 [Ixodes persulcatus]|uniref:Uncharacterized protein n=1 Tax=Ixodes persulcatus TaxID=34615 RepID=A0AC60P8R5_IXOPE|nr:hypothetical protein HPB47_006946 [Ixodes persulcatus]